MNIGFFDSGLGGLTILKAVAQALPQYSYEFYGDTAHLPYGNRSEGEVLALTKAGVEHLFSRDCSLVIIACNTASAETLRTLQDTFLREQYSDRKILGVIIPTVEAIIDTGVEQVTMIATRRTVESQKYERELGKFYNAPNFTAVATPALVPHIEAGELEMAFKLIVPILDMVVQNKKERRQGLVLGCTHYTLLKELIREHCGNEVVVYTQDEIIPSKLEQYLGRHPEIHSRLSKGEDSFRNIFLTAPSSRYDVVIEHMLGGVVSN